MGVTVGPGGYLLNFTKYGIQINGGHEVMTDRLWLGETNFDFNHRKEGHAPNATAIQINGNDHYVLNTIVFSSKVGVAVHGAADYIEGTHVWFPNNVALAFKDEGAMAFYVTGSSNRFNGCYIDGGRGVFTGGGLKNNIWMNGFECCAAIRGVNHGLILKGDTIGPGLHFTHNIFGSGSIVHESSSDVSATSDCTWDAPVAFIAQCNGLHNAAEGDKSAEACEQSCCTDATCGVFQWADSTGGAKEGGCWIGRECTSAKSGNVSWIGATRSVRPAGASVTDVRIEHNSFPHKGKGSKASLTQKITKATSATFDFCDRLIFQQIATAKVSVMAESGFPTAVARPASGCKVTVEIDIEMTGSITVDVDSSEYQGYLV